MVLRCVPFNTYISCCRSGLTIVTLSLINLQALLPHVCAERAYYQVCFIFRDRYRLFLLIILVYSRSFSSSRSTSTSELRWHATMEYVKIEISLYHGSWNYRCLWTLVVYISRISNRHASATSWLCSDVPFISPLSASTLSFLGLSTLLVTHFHHSNVYVSGIDINQMHMAPSLSGQRKCNVQLHFLRSAARSV